MPEDTSSKKIDEVSDSLNTRKFYLLLLFVSFIGIIGALMMIAFVFLQESLTAILWKDIPVDSFPRFLILLSWLSVLPAGWVPG